MLPRVKSGLIVGVVSAILNIVISSLFGLCGPLFALLVGAGAGFWTARMEKAATRGDGAKAAAISGLIVGGCLIVSQMIAAVIALTITKASGMTPIIGTIPSANAPAAQQAIFWGAGAGAGFCFGIIDIAAAILAAAGVGALATSPYLPGSGDPTYPRPS
jgi:hypothetical protein